jgi:pimeloyl-ACP methyl ester carboxylesterase
MFTFSFFRKLALLGCPPSWVVGLVILGSSALSGAPATHQPGEVATKPWTLLTPSGEKIECELGTLYVPENRANPASRVIGVGFLRIKAAEPTGAPPTFHLPGGPANSYLLNLNANKPDEKDRVAPSGYADDIALYRKVSDMVYFDQRGFSQAAGEVLTYTFQTKDYPLDQPYTLARDTQEFVDATHAAIAEFTAKGVDLKGYTVHECAADLNDLRKALGYDKVVLVGQSFGGQWTFATMRLFPQIVARAIISGVEPLDLGYDMPSHIYASMRRMWFAAEQDARFKAYLPAGGIAAAVRDIIRRFDQGPLKVTVKDEKSGQDVTVTLGRDDFRPNPLEPAQILAIYHRQYEAWAKGIVNRRRAHKSSFALIGPLIDTALAVTPLRRHLLRTDAAIDILGEWNFDDYMATEEIWPTANVGDEFRTEVQQTTPVLFVQGTWDTSTPMENLVTVMPFFVNSRALIVNQGEHGAFARVRRTLPAATAAIMEFVRSGSTANLPSHVTVGAREFRAPDFPAPAGNATQGATKSAR